MSNDDKKNEDNNGDRENDKPDDKLADDYEDLRKAAGNLLGFGKKMAGKAADAAKKNPTLAGAAGGFFTGGPVGAAIGAALGNDKAREKMKKAASAATDAAKDALEGNADLSDLKDRFKGATTGKKPDQQSADAEDSDIIDGDFEELLEDDDAPETPDQDNQQDNRPGGNGPRP